MDCLVFFTQVGSECSHYLYSIFIKKIAHTHYTVCEKSGHEKLGMEGFNLSAQPKMVGMESHVSGN